jgi:hypothetical protein
LIEESRTNVATYSEDYTQSVWTKNNTTITSNTIIAPDGFLTGSKLIENTSNIAHTLWIRPNYILGNYYSFSFYAKSAEKSILISNLFNNASPYARANFNLSSGTTTASTQTGCSSSIVDVGNGWYRCTLIGLADVTTTGYALLGLTSDGYTDTVQEAYTGDGYSGVYIWGAQVEQGSFPTSYIKTTGSTVTRSADASKIANINTSEWFKQGEGTLFLEVGDNNKWQGYFPRALTIVNDAKTNFIQFRKKSGASTPTTAIAIDLTMNTYATTYYNNTSINGISKKLVFSYKRNDSASITNLNSINTDTTVEIPSDFTELHLGQYNADATNITGSRFNTTLRKLSYYPLRLTDNEITDLSEE